MRISSWLQFLHVLGAMAWVGGGATLSLAGLQARRSDDAAAIAQFARTLRYIGIRLMMPAVIVVLGTGVWLVLASAEWHFSQTWVLVGLGLFGFAFLVGAVYLSGVAARLERAVAAPGGAAASALVARWLVGYALVLVTLLAALWDMVFKPGS